MGHIRLSSGALLNLLARANSLTSSTTETAHDIDYAVDGDAGRPVVFAGGTTETIEADLSPDLYGDFEVWDGAVPAGFNAAHSGSGVGALDSVTFFAGAKSAALQAGASGVAAYYIDRQLPAGEEQTFTGQLQISSGAGTVHVYLQCLQTRRYLNSAGAWQAAETPLFSSSSAGAWDAKTLVASLEDYAATGVDTVTIRQTIKCSDNCTANVDALHIVPSWDVLAIIGHNADASQAIEVYGGSTAPASNLVETGSQPPAAPSCYILAPARQTYRYVKIVFPAENVEQLHIGEVVLAQLITPGQGWLAIERTRTPLQVRSGTIAGRPGGVRTGVATRSYKLDLMPTTDAEDVELEGEMMLRTLDGMTQVLLIPDDGKPDVILGRVPPDPKVSTPEPLSAIRKYSLVIVEDGLPNVGR